MKAYNADKVKPETAGSYPRKKPKSQGIYIERGRELLASKAWIALTGVSTQVYGLFLCKRVFQPRRRGSKNEYDLANNGEIVFTYREAEQKHGITQRQFGHAIDDLIKHGFLDVARPGKPYARIPTLYSICERWRLYGTDRFEEKERVKGLNTGYCSKAKKTKPKKPSGKEVGYASHEEKPVAPSGRKAKTRDRKKSSTSQRSTLPLEVKR